MPEEYLDVPEEEGDWVEDQGNMAEEDGNAEKKVDDMTAWYVGKQDWNVKE